VLVIAPKNAFMAWEDELVRCAPEAGFDFTRLTGGRSRIQELLLGRPNAAIITYQQLPRVVDLLAQFMVQHPCYLFLDESHRMKRGIEGVQGSCVLQISHLPKRKLIMSGTPMPNSVADLVPQFTFLYPEIHVDLDTVVPRLQPIYVRTTKRDLDLEDPIRTIHEVPMSLGQQRLYETLSSDAARRAEGLNINDRSRLRAFARSVQHMLQAASNPALLINSDLHNHPLLRDALEDGLSPKLIETCRIARELALRNQKVIIWSYFVNTVLHITALLEDLGAEPIYGAISTSEDEELTDTREARIRRFHNDQSCMVLVANPAACAEGISLHEVCHNAIYVDRNYNAAQYLQSEDRIHRIGIPKGIKTYVTILQSPATLDISVDRRLRVKVESMSRVLRDPGLSINPLDLDEASPDVLDEDDLADLKELLRGA
jgi:SNF2 family DNA or RNA helicase